MSIENKAGWSNKILARHPPTDGPVVGRLRRRDGEDGHEATARAMELGWWCDGLQLDGRTTRWWVWRQTKEGE